MFDETAYDEGKLNAVRNPDGIWINTSVFSEAANTFLKKGYYTPDPWGSPAWYEYWTEERRRCIEGYSVGGARITGEHYFYLNYLQIKLTEDPTLAKSRKITSFPKFWDGDYNYFWVRQIAKEGVFQSFLSPEEFEESHSWEEEKKIKKAIEFYERLNLEVDIPSHEIIEGVDGEEEVKHNLLGGFNLIVGKARRKGYTYKAAAIGTCNYFTKPDSYTMFGAYEKRFLYPRGIFTMAKDNISFVNEHTAWAMPSDYINKQDHIKASYKEVKNGVELEKGFKSEIQALTYKDNPDAARGKDVEDGFFEESGAFGVPGLLKRSYQATQDCVMDGLIKTGMLTIFGTSGDMSGGTADYADMFSRPEAFDLLPFRNIWDKDSKKQKVGFFHPINWNLPGFYDEQGNSDKESAKLVELNERKRLIKKGATTTEMQARGQERPLGPAEAFSAVSFNNFPVVELKQQLQKVKANDWQFTKGTPVELLYEEGEITAKPILDGSVEPITSLRNLPLDLRGCPMIYEMPVPNSPKGLYKIGYDPIRQDEGTSLAAIIVYKGVHRGSQYHNIIVAEYIGRLESPEDIDRVAEKFADLYNAQIMHENEVTGVRNYFRKIKRLNLLAHQPDAVISKNVKQSKVARVYGCHMVGELKDAGERYVKDWLLKTLDYDENGDPVRVIDRIYSIRLLEELISYYRKGNFDLVSALFMCLFQVEEDAVGKEYSEENSNKRIEELKELMEEMYK